jgi:hypothetical protein
LLHVPDAAAASRAALEETRREKDLIILRKDEEIERMKEKMEDMAQEFGDMLAGRCCTGHFARFWCALIPRRCSHCLATAQPASLRHKPIALLHETMQPAETLRKMGDRIELQASAWEGDGSMPVIRRMEDFSSAAKA